MVRSIVFPAALALALPAAVSAHGYMSSPNPVFADIYNKKSPSALLPGTPGPYSGSEEVKALAEKAGSKCGKTDANAPVQPIPSDGVLAFDISAVHIGPCEVWLENTKVASAKECWKEFPDKRIKVDLGTCKSGSCQLRWVWMATHTSPWEFFDNCVRVGSGGGGAGGDDSNEKEEDVPSASRNSTTAAPATQATEAKPGIVEPSTKDDSTKDADKCGRGVEPSLDDWCKANCAAGFCPESHCQPC